MTTARGKEPFSVLGTLPKMTRRKIIVTTASRLHFGLLSFGGSAARQYGGLGAMVDRPGLRISVSAAPRLEVSGPIAERAGEFAERFHAATGGHGSPPYRIDVESAPPEHIGLGTGTQLGLAIGSALARLSGQADLSAEEVARLVGRGRRSAIGSHGFALGGLLFERGKLAGEDLSPLTNRVPLPAAWRFVLIWPIAERGLSGDAEVEAFERLPAVAPTRTERLARLATEEILPAAAAADFARFSRNLYQFGFDAGMCFASYQGGPFASPEVAALVERLRRLGIEGVGQSSWGPAVYALLPDEESAQECARPFVDGASPSVCQCVIARPANVGANITVE